MSAAKLFPPFQAVEPLTLVEAIQSLSTIHSGSGANNPRRWDRLIEKLRMMKKLAPFEKIQMIRNAGAIPIELQDAFGQLFRDSLTQDELITASHSIAVSLAPTEAVSHLTNLDLIKTFGSSHLPKGVFKAGSALGHETKESEWILNELKQGTSITEIVDSFAVKQLGSQRSVGQKRIIRSIATSKGLVNVLNQQFKLIFSLLQELKDEGIDSLALVDEILGNYFAFDQQWGTKVLDEKFFLSQVPARLPSLTNEKIRFHQYRNLELLQKKINEINDVLKMLNEVEPDRGTFWKKYLSLCQYIEPKRLDKGSVATAFAFPTFIIVEFAPVGTSALLYERSVFDSTVRKTKNWRDLQYVKPFLPYSKDGRLLHVSNWQRNFNELIVELLRNSGSLR